MGAAVRVFVMTDRHRAPRVGIVDLTVGNIFSVTQAVAAVGMEPCLIRTPSEVAACEAIILPGVGAFPTAADFLRSSGMDAALRESAADGKLLVGVCLGLQLLFESSTEFGHHAGLGILPGQVDRFLTRSGDGSRYRVPHMGWADVEWSPGERHGPLAEVAQRAEPMYFVHSYMVPAAGREFETAYARYAGVRFVAAVRRGNVWGFQFHPERSGPGGLAVYQAVRRALSGVGTDEQDSVAASPHGYSIP